MLQTILKKLYSLLVMMKLLLFCSSLYLQDQPMGSPINVMNKNTIIKVNFTAEIEL